MTEPRDVPAGKQVAGAPAYTMIFDQSAHLDWDWIRTFPQYYWYAYDSNGVQAILDQAIKNLQTFNSPNDKPYYYTICEMGFFQKYIQENPSQAAAIQQQGNNFQVISGGITSPDCLVCSGEGFIRNYLVGHLWLSQALPSLKPKPHCWIPDDFGQDSELPALLTALGFVSVGFARLPGTWSTCHRDYPNDVLTQNGVDFIWQTSDGSQVITHWMLGPPTGYGFGNQLENGPGAINNFTAAYVPSNATPPLYSAAATPAMYIPLDDDFSMPVPGLLNDVQQWNDNVVQQGANNSNVATIDGTFDQFIGKLNTELGALKTFAYNGTPYWTGYYASRAELKILHYETVRALTAAEVFALLTQPSNPSLNNMLPAAFWNDMADAWADFAPSTHHDYVCGTASDPVYAGEQLPLLQATAAAARGLRGAALNALASMVASNGNTGYAPVLVANPLGFQHNGLAEIANVVVPGVQSISFNGTSTKVQRSFEGGMLFMASAPSMGYVSGHLSTTAAPKGPSASITPPTTGATSYVLSNDLLSATVSQAANWGLAGMNDTQDGGFNILSSGAIGNDLVLYKDSGDIYQFGNEYVDGGGGTFQPDNATFVSSGPGLGAVVLEAGPLRVRLRTTVLVTASSGEARYCTREYLLVAGEPFLRMTTTAQAPLYYSAMVRFPLAAAVAAITHGTAYHWTSVQPLSGYWGPPTFQATHDFLIPQDVNDTPLAAAYHAAMPAWAYDNSGALIGCLTRNTPSGGGLGAVGSDPAPHTRHYALRVPTGLGQPATGQPLKEALAFNSPLQAVEISPGNTYYQFPGMLPGNGNLASVTNDGPGILTVAKPGSLTPTNLIFRLYQPTNQTTQTVQVTFGSNIKPASVSVVTAVEGPWNGVAMPIQKTANGFTLTMNAAVATVQVTPA
jgi:alpha-mannosidase